MEQSPSVRQKIEGTRKRLEHTAKSIDAATFTDETGQYAFMFPGIPHPEIITEPDGQLAFDVDSRTESLREKAVELSRTTSIIGLSLDTTLLRR